MLDFDINKLLQTESYNQREILVARQHQNEIADYILPRVNGTSPITNRFYDFIEKKLSGEQLIEFCKWIPETHPTTSLVVNDIKPDLEKVFDAKDAKFSYSKDKDKEQVFTDYLKTKNLQNYVKEIVWEELFKAHNSVLVVDLEPEPSVNSPYPLLVKIANIVAIKYDNTNDKILEIFYKGKHNLYYYITESYYAVFTKNTKDINSYDYVQFGEEIYHNLNECPATFIAPVLSDQYKVVRKSFFSNLLPEFDMFNFLSIYADKIMPYLVSPVLTHSVLNTEFCNSSFADGTHCEEGFLYNTDNTIVLTNDNRAMPCPNCRAKLNLKPGIVVQTPMIMNTSGGVENLNKDFLKFHTPDVNAVKYTAENIEARRQRIIAQVIGVDKQTFTSEAVNEKQVASSSESKQSTLSSLSKFLSTLHKKVFTWLYKYQSTEYDKLTIDINYGLAFLLENELSIINRINNTTDEWTKEILQTEHLLYKFGKDSSEYQKVKIMSDLHISTANTNTLLQLVDKGLTTREDYLYELNFTNLVKEFELDKGSIIDYVNSGIYSEKIKEIKQYMKGLIPKQQIIYNSNQNDTAQHQSKDGNIDEQSVSV